MFEKMRYDDKSCMVIYRSKLHATLKRNYQLMPALKWLRLLMNHDPDKYKQLVRYCGYYSNRSRGARRLAEQDDYTPVSVIVDDIPANTRRRANWARLIQKVYEVDPLECSHCGATMRIIAFIDDAEIIERILMHLNARDPPPETIACAGSDPPLPKDESAGHRLSDDPGWRSASRSMNRNTLGDSGHPASRAGTRSSASTHCYPNPLRLAPRRGFADQSTTARLVAALSQLTKPHAAIDTARRRLRFPAHCRSAVAPPARGRYSHLPVAGINVHGRILVVDHNSISA